MTAQELLSEIRREVESRMLVDYNSDDIDMDEVAQGVCAGILVYLDTIDLEEKS